MTSFIRSMAAVMLLIVFFLNSTTSSKFNIKAIKKRENLLSLVTASALVALSPSNQFALVFVSTSTAVALSANHYLSQRNVSSVEVEKVKLEKCPEEFDMTKREAQFAFRSTDLRSWNSSSVGGINTDSDPKNFQHWAVVVHFPRGNKTIIFEAWDENGLLQPTRAENVDYKVFADATHFATNETCPFDLLEKAKQVPTGNYSVVSNNCQTWLKAFLEIISRELLQALYDKVPGTLHFLECDTRECQDL